MMTTFQELYQRMVEGEEIDAIIDSLESLTSARRCQLKLKLRQYQNEDMMWRDRGLQEVSTLSTRCLRALVSNRRESEEWLDAIRRLSNEGARSIGPALKAELGRLYEDLQARMNERAKV